MDRMMSDEDVKNFSDGILETYQEPLKHVSANLSELVIKQKDLIEVIATKNQQIQSLQNSEDLNKMFSDIIHCREQLALIKKQMILLHEKSVRLKSKAQNIATYTKNRHDARLAELNYEQNLIGNDKT